VVRLELDVRVEAGARVPDLTLDPLDEPGPQPLRRDEYPVSTLNRSVMSAQIASSAVNRPRSSYIRAVFGL
jgi:hypothetical protein